VTDDEIRLDRLAVANEREAAWCGMQARALRARAKAHREAAERLREYLAGAPR
jgi:hypothetical protein